MEITWLVPSDRMLARFPIREDGFVARFLVADPRLRAPAPRHKLAALHALRVLFRSPPVLPALPPSPSHRRRRRRTRGCARIRLIIIIILSLSLSLSLIIPSHTHTSSFPLPHTHTHSHSLPLRDLVYDSQRAHRRTPVHPLFPVLSAPASAACGRRYAAPTGERAMLTTESTMLASEVGNTH
jgi:hypothetical protein